MNLDNMNDKQKEAIYATDGPLLVLAGAGSGKTRVITHRIAYLIEECGVNPYNILAITFTNKAAKEMRDRVDRLVSFGAESVWVSTFHSMCVRILRKHIDKIGGTRDFTIYDTDEQKVVIKEVIKYLNVDNKMYPEKAMLAAISKAKENYMSPDDYEKEHATSFRDQQIARIYREYQKRLKSNNALDFDDLIYQTIFLFETNPDALAEYQERFRYIMVDEYQDTNHTQFILIKQLAAKYKNLCVVGDDDQSIYKFRGANIYNILNFENQYPDAKVVKLEQNYRSTANILNTANAVIANNEGRKDKTLWTSKEEGDLISFSKYNNEYDEAEKVVMEIRSLRRADESLNDIAVLYRTNNQSRIIEEKLIYSNIPYKLYGGTNFYSRKEIRDVVSYLKILVNPSDDTAIKRIINVPKRGIGDTTVEKVFTFAIDNGINLYDAFLDINEVPSVARAAEKIRKFTDMIEGIKKKLNGDAFISEVFDMLIEETGYVEELRLEGTDEAKARIENIDELRNKIVKYEEDAENPNLTELLEEISLVADTESDDGEDSDKVTLMTLHSAKGLEFPYVFIIGMEEGLFPSQMSMNSDDPDAVEEERRLCYVGITRAMKKLYLSAASTRMMRGVTNYNDISRFIKEIPSHYLDSKGAMVSAGGSVNSGDNSIGKQIVNIGYGRPKTVYKNYGANNPYSKSSNPSANPGFGKAFPMGQSMNASSYAVGDEVKHLKFGKGVVTGVVKAGSDQEITVDFERCGTKKMFASLVKMKKL